MEVSLGAGGAATCRCCLAPGVAAKDLSSEYDFMGEKEVYADMLLESFDITLSRAVNAGWVICDSCITRLRDSSNFKKQVLHSEKCLLQKSKAGVASTEDVAESKLELTVLKQEEDSDDDHADFETLFYDEEDHNELKKPVVKTEPLASTSNDMSNDEDVPLSSLTAGVKRKARPIKTDTLPKYLRVGPKQLKDPPVRLKVLPAASAKTAPKAPLPRPAVKVGGIKVQLAKESAQKLATSKLSGRQLKITLKNPSTAAVKKGKSPATLDRIIGSNKSEPLGQRLENQKAQINSVILLKCSNITPFKWNLQSGYRCFYCEHLYMDAQLLRTHTLEDHTTDKLGWVLKHFPNDKPIKVDVGSIQCKLCMEKFGSIEHLKNHLIRHGKKFHDEVWLGVLPFRLDNDKFDCIMCDLKFNTFHTLNHHVTKHFSNYFCVECNDGFVSARLLREHMLKHTIGFRCRICKISFASAHEVRKHQLKDHFAGRFQCPHCPEAFSTRTDTELHCIKIHNETQLEHKCDICGKTFMRKSTLAKHKRSIHLKEVNHTCEVCGAQYFAKSALKLHMIRHTGVKSLECKYCHKMLARPRSLKLHMRIHENDRRHVCDSCGEAFVQSSSLKSHMKAHHSKESD